MNDRLIDISFHAGECSSIRKRFKLRRHKTTGKKRKEQSGRQDSGRMNQFFLNVDSVQTDIKKISDASRNISESFRERMILATNFFEPIQGTGRNKISQRPGLFHKLESKKHIETLKCLFQVFNKVFKTKLGPFYVFPTVQMVEGLQ
jgi:hypothetical protein